MDITDSQHPFDEGLSDWINSVNGAVEKEITENPEKYREFFDKINIILILFSSIAEELPVDHAIWIHGEREIPSRSSNIQLIMEFLTQSIYMEASHLWPAANHSARCALEHTLWTVWQIVEPKESQRMIGSHEKTKFKQMLDTIMDIPRFAACKNKFDFSKATDQTWALRDKILEVYGHLSYYVHTSNIHIEQKGARPHITHDLGKNPKAERDTHVNISETFDLILIMFTITCKQNLGDEEMKQIEQITSTEIYEILNED